MSIIPFVLIYSLLYLILLPVFIIRTILKDKNSLWQKLGFNYNSHNLPIHIHCTSVGEFNASIPLIDKFLHNYKVVITTTTKTGAIACKNYYGNKVTHYYFPFDLGFICQRFFLKINPKISIILETEVWPNFLTTANKNQVKIILINARLSTKSLRKYQKVNKFSRLVFNKFNLILTQDSYNYQNFKILGIKNVTIAGNIKFDIFAKTNPTKLDEVQNIINHRESIVCASTHAPEEKMLIKSYINNPCMELLIIIPRHPQRFIEVENILKNAKINYIKQSDKQKCTLKTQVLLADSMGYVLEYYALCKLAFIGGSLSHTGGHNMLEAIAFNKLAIFGSGVFNFKNISQTLLKNNAAICIDNSDDFFDLISKYNNKSAKYQLVINNAKDLMQKNKGASTKIFEKIESLIH